MLQRLIDESRRNKAMHLDKIAQNNQDLKGRISTDGVELDYLPDDDYLRITVGAPAESISITAGEALYLSVMVDPDTYKVNAIEVPDFMASLKKMPPSPARDFWTAIADMVSEREGVSLYFPSRAARERAENALRDLALIGIGG